MHAGVRTRLKSAPSTYNVLPQSTYNRNQLWKHLIYYGCITGLPSYVTVINLILEIAFLVCFFTVINLCEHVDDNADDNFNSDTRNPFIREAWNDHLPRMTRCDTPLGQTMIASLLVATRGSNQEGRSGLPWICIDEKLIHILCDDWGSISLIVVSCKSISVDHCLVCIWIVPKIPNVEK